MGVHTMYIIKHHNLKEKNYNLRESAPYEVKGNRTPDPNKFVWVDRSNGRFHVESMSRDIFTTNEPLMLWWLVNSNKRDAFPLTRQFKEDLAEMPLEYDAVVRLRIEKYKPSKADRLYQKIILERHIMKGSTFGCIDKPSIISAVMPVSNQKAIGEITQWVQYIAMPVNNYILQPNKPSIKLVASQLVA